MAARSHIVRTLSLLLFLFGLFQACASSPDYVPQPSPDQIDLGQRVTARNDKLNVTVEYAPLYAEGQVTAFRVGVRNLSDAPITLSPVNFRLVDADRRQYPAVLPKDLADSRSFYCRPRFGSSIYWHWPHHDPFWGRGWLGERDLECDRPGPSPFSDSLLPMPALLPNAHAKGLVFFRGRPPEGERLELSIAVPGAEALRFQFAPDDG